MSNWIKRNGYLSTAEMQNNALIIYAYLKAKGWSINAISGMLGNMQTESTINPAIWQSLIEGAGGGGGFGLVQWTPWTNFTDWADANGYEWTDGNAQLKWIDEQTAAVGQWIATSSYNFSFSDFKTSTETPEYLASAFLKNFERAGVEKEEARRTQARTWYNFLVENGEETNQNAKIIESAVNWAIGIANDDTHGYDQTHRDSPDYDCSSLTFHAYQQAGLDVIGEGNGTYYTGNLRSCFVKQGFEAIPYESGMELVKGDVILNESHHVVIYIGNNQVVNAGSNENGGYTGGQTGDQTGKEIYIRSMYEYPTGGWDYVLRLPVSGDIPDIPDEPDEPDPPEPPHHIPTTKLSKLLLYAVATDLF